LTRAQEAYAELLLEMRERTPQHAALVSPETPTWRDVARRLAPDEAFIEYLVSDSGSLAFVIVSDTFAAVDLGAGRRELARLAARSRRDRAARRPRGPCTHRWCGDRRRVPPRGADPAHPAPRHLWRPQQAQPVVLLRRPGAGRRAGRAARGARGVRAAAAG